MSLFAAGVLVLAGGCVTPDGGKGQWKKPDVTQPGVLPPPGGVSAAPPAGGVVQAGGTQPAAPAAVAPAAPAIPSFSKIGSKFEKKVPASEMEVAWRNRIAYLPDPTRNGVMGPGIAGQMFLFGGPKLDFAEADGVLTVDLIDKTPRPAGQAAVTPERWQFNKEMLLRLQAMDETFGKSYVLFLPWPAYRPGVTQVEISARYDPDNGHTLYARPTVVTLDPSTPHGTPVWEDKGTTTTTGIPAQGVLMQPLGGAIPGAPNAAPAGGMMPAGGAPAPLMHQAPVAFPPPGATPIAPTAPIAPAVPQNLPPIAISTGR